MVLIFSIFFIYLPIRTLQTTKYTNFRKTHNFKTEPITTENGCVYFRNELIEDETKKYAEGTTFINIGYNFKYSLAKCLSNLYPISFKFRGKKVASIEGVLQGIKYKDKKMQNAVLKYYGLDAYHTRGANTANFWGNSGILYWQGKPINRHSEEYQLFLDELYIAATKNPIYKSALLATEDKYLLHHIGNTNPQETVLTREEYEQRLNTLRDFITKN